MSKITDIKHETVQKLKDNPLVTFSEARLIPTIFKPGDEVPLTSIFLSGLRLVDEFRKDIFKLLDMKGNGSLHFLAEVDFHDTKEKAEEKLANNSNNGSRFDGFILNEIKGKIDDVTIFEMKHKNFKIDKTQIEKYIEKAKELKIKRIVTISNEFTSSPKTPTILKHDLAGGIKLYHLSWTEIMTKASLRIHKHNSDSKDIKDINQQRIMEEIWQYMSHKDTGVKGFTQMNSWNKDLFASISRKEIKQDDSELIELINSWKQEEQDLCQLLTREMKQYVKLNKKYPSSLNC